MDDHDSALADDIKRCDDEHDRLTSELVDALQNPGELSTEDLRSAIVNALKAMMEWQEELESLQRQDS